MRGMVQLLPLNRGVAPTLLVLMDILVILWHLQPQRSLTCLLERTVVPTKKLVIQWQEKLQTWKSFLSHRGAAPIPLHAIELQDMHNH